MAKRRRRQYEEEAVELGDVLQPYDQQPVYEETDWQEEYLQADSQYADMYVDQPYVEEYSEAHEAVIEAVLFTMGESVEISKLAELIEESKSKTKKIVYEMKEKLQQSNRGVDIIELEDSFQMCTKTDMYTCIRDNIKQVYYSEDVQEEKISLNK